MINMHIVPVLACATTICGAALLVPAAQVAPPASKPAVPATPAAPRAPGTPAAPSGPATQAPQLVNPVLPKIFETQVIAAPSPTISMLFGIGVSAANGQFLVTGPVRATQAGRFGQLANFILKDGIWTANKEMADVSDMAFRDGALRRNAAAGRVFATCIERLGPSASTVAVFEPDGENWSQVGVLASPHSIERPGFGSAVATDGETIAVSSVDLRYTKKLNLPIENPEVYLFSRQVDGWKMTGKVLVQPVPSRVRTSYWFGSTLAMDRDVLAVGAPKSVVPRVHEPTPSGTDAFVAIYRKGPEGWVADGEVLGEDVTKFAGFGNEIAIEGDVLAVQGVEIGDDRTPARVWVYRRMDGKWRMVNELVPATGLYAGRTFGSRIVISKGRILVSESTTMAADNGPDRSLGMVLVFEEREGRWLNTMRLQPRERCMPGQFGTDIAAMWPWVAVGRVKNEREGIAPGGAYLYKLGP